MCFAEQQPYQIEMGEGVGVAVNSDTTIMQKHDAYVAEEHVLLRRR